MQLRVLAIGKLKDKGLESLCEEYVRRSRSMLPMQRVTCRSAREQLDKAGADGAVVILLDERGEQVETTTLAAWMREYRERGIRRVDLLIGDAQGHGDEARARADRLLALSRLTLPHRLAQLMLCEQLYRVGTVLAGHPYHHA